MIQSMLANALREHKAGRLAEAERLCLQILAIDVRHAESLHLLGLVVYSAGRPEVAARMIRRAIAINNKEAAYYSNLGNALHAQGELDEAVAEYKRALALNPNCEDARYNLGNTLRDQGKLDEAVAEYKQALAIRTDFAEAHNNLGVALRTQAKADEAIDHLQLAIKLKPDFADACNNLANALEDQGKLEDAVAWYERSLALDPNNASVHHNKAMAHLLAGDFAPGWRGQEWRWQANGALRGCPLPQWRGQPLDGARIVLAAEQGLGDVIQFLRYFPLVQAAGGSVVLSLPASLHRLAAQLPGVAALVAPGEPVPHCDWHCPLMSLPLAFGTTLETIPARVPYLTVPEEALRTATARAWPATGLRVGLVWAGNPAHARDQFRSVPLALLEPVLTLEDGDLAGVHFFSLQMGPGAAQLEGTRAAITNLAPAIGDLADTAALIAHLDLVIAVDTSVAHLAGALGKPVWVLLPSAPDWRWLRDREDSPWYPTMRLFRQTRLGDWQPVVEKVRNALVEECKAMEPGRGSATGVLRRRAHPLQLDEAATGQLSIYSQ